MDRHRRHCEAGLAPGGVLVALALALALGLGGCSAPEVLGPPRADLVVNGPPGRGRHRPPTPVLATAVPGAVSFTGSGLDQSPPDSSSASRSSEVAPRAVEPQTSVSYGPPPASGR